MTESDEDIIYGLSIRITQFHITLEAISTKILDRVIEQIRQPPYPEEFCIVKTLYPSLNVP